MRLWIVVAVGGWALIAGLLWGYVALHRAPPPATAGEAIQDASWPAETDVLPVEMTTSTENTPEMGSEAVSCATERRCGYDDVVNAVIAAADAHGLPRYMLLCTAYQESRWWPYAVGRAGEQGSAQLHPAGKLLDFYAAHYRDPYDPVEAWDYTAAAIADGQGPAWAGWGKCQRGES